MTKLVFGVSGTPDTNRTIHITGLKFGVQKVGGLYCLCSEHKGVDQLRGCAFVFAYAQSRLSHDGALIIDDLVRFRHSKSTKLVDAFSRYCPEENPTKYFTTTRTITQLLTPMFYVYKVRQRHIIVLCHGHMVGWIVSIINPFVTNGLLHLPHLDESTFI